MKPGVIYNQDCTEFFMANPPEAMMAGEVSPQVREKAGRLLSWHRLAFRRAGC